MLFGTIYTRTRMNLILPTLLIFIAMVKHNEAMCPSRCVCADQKLETSCIDAGLEVVPIQLNPEVQSIILKENRITNVHYTLSFYNELKTLDLSVNKINVLGSHNFEFQNKLLHLNISYNEIVSLGKDTFKGLKLLKTLDLSYNKINDINKTAFRDTTNLEMLILSNNNITYFEESEIFTTLKTLRILKLDNNQILDVPDNILSNLPHQSLHFLYLNDNLIETVGENSFPFTMTNLHTLSLSSNIISSINETSFVTLRSLHSIDLSGNNLSTIPTKQLSKLNSLVNLDLSGNYFHRIDSVAFKSLFALKSVKINLIPTLDYVDQRAFVDNVQLETVVINENMNLKQIPLKLFQGNSNLKHISLKGNYLSALEAAHFPLERITYLDLTDNPLDCTCNLLWLWVLVQLQVKSMLDMTTVTQELVQNTTGTPLHPIATTPEVPKLDNILNHNHSLTIALNNLKCSTPLEIKGLEVKNVGENYVHCDANTFIYVISLTLLIISLLILCVLMYFIFKKRSLWKDKINRNLKQRPYTDNCITTHPTPILMLYSTPKNEYENNEKLNSFPNGKLCNDNFQGQIQIYDKYTGKVSPFHDDHIYQKEPLSEKHSEEYQTINGTLPSRQENEYYPKKIPINDSFKGKISKNNFSGKFSSNENFHHSTPGSFNSGLRKKTSSQSQDVQYFDQWKNHSNGIYANPNHTLNPSTHRQDRSDRFNDTHDNRSRTSRKQQGAPHIVYV